MLGSYFYVFLNACLFLATYTFSCLVHAAVAVRSVSAGPPVYALFPVLCPLSACSPVWREMKLIDDSPISSAWEFTVL